MPVTSRMRNAAVISASLHAIILAALLISFPWTTPPEPPETAVSMEIEGGASAEAMKSERTGKTPAPAEKPVVDQKPPAPTPPTDQPIEPPPPPPPPPAAAAPAVPTPPVMTPPPELSPLDEPTPPQKQAPPQPAAAPSTSTQKQLQPVKTPTPPSRSSQPNPTTNAAPDSSALDNTLEKLRAMQAQTAPPKARANPSSGGAPDAGGSSSGSDTGLLSKGEMGTIGAHVRDCWSIAGAGGAENLSTFAARLRVVVDGQGIVRQVFILNTTGNPGKSPDTLRFFAEAARRALLDSQCATLPLPPRMLGQTRTFDFNFRP